LLPDLATFVSLVQASPGVIAFSVGPSPVPFLGNVTLAHTIVDFDYAFTGVEPLGIYFAYAGLVVAGGDPLVPANHISLAVRSFRFGP
jgi:hypothetical protein